jgi:transposase
LLQLRECVEAKPDHTLEELQRKLLDEANFKLSIGRLWQLLRKLGLRLKKSRFTPPSGTP